MWYFSFPTWDQNQAPCTGHTVLTSGPPGVSLDLLIPSDSHDGNRASSGIQLLETHQPLGWNRHAGPCTGSSNYSVSYRLQNAEVAGWHPSAGLHASGRWHPLPRFLGVRQFSSGSRPSPPRAS